MTGVSGSSMPAADVVSLRITIGPEFGINCSGADRGVSPSR